MSGREPITVEGHKSLQEELKRLKSIERPKVIEAIAVAREHGDLSENAEYDAAKEKQGFIEGRIKEIETKLPACDIIDISKLSGDKVVFGATVTLSDVDTDKEVTYKIVGVDEADVKTGKISILSPIARGLIGKSVDDEVSIATPSGNKEFEIIEVSFI
ncbi:MAG: transcription elongation factor GreA [Deltaproteobacteria bacterium]|nr:transcription elongation factor GreA [Deltaproteobacteria bacterium]